MPRLFAERLDEIGGSVTYSSSRLLAPTLPFAPYIPKIHNGSSREEKLPIPQVVIPGRELISISGKNVSCRFRTPREVRNHFCLSDRTAYIVSCVTNDNDVEATWKGLKYGGLAKDIARLKPAAVIVPNFSFFVEDVPRTHILYNRKRIAQAAEILSAMGCPVILPLNALTTNDWEFWFSLLRENPATTYVAKAFQTGLKKRVIAMRAIED
ncbi:MAG: DUF4417 domain-containing protein, partial [Armatimonadota bacterium]|nr:DUF4417 domain-containing protein [Armatimonadota bacterium]